MELAETLRNSIAKSITQGFESMLQITHPFLEQFLRDQFIPCGSNVCDMVWLLLVLLLCVSVSVCIFERHAFHTIVVFSHLCFKLVGPGVPIFEGSY